MTGIDWATLLEAILFALFADLTAIVAAVIGPTYNNLLVPSLSSGALYPPLLGTAGDSSNYLVLATHFSTYVLVDVVDPAAALFALAVAVAYLSKALLARWAQTLDGLLLRLVVALVAANFTVPIASAVLDVGGALYPVFAGWDGGSWRSWGNLAGWGEISFSWDNGALAFLLSLVEFALVFALVLAVGVRDALLAVLIVILPLLTLLWPLRPFSPLARRAWFLFLELAFLPCVLVVPLELAVGSPNPVLLVGFLGAAVASPYLLSLAGTHLVAFGFPGAGGTVQGSVARGLSSTPDAATTNVRPLGTVTRASERGPHRAVAGAIGGTTRVAGSASGPAAAPLVAAELVGHGALGLVRHFRPGSLEKVDPRPWDAIRPGGPR